MARHRAVLDYAESLGKSRRRFRCKTRVAEAAAKVGDGFRHVIQVSQVPKPHKRGGARKGQIYGRRVEQTIRHEQRRASTHAVKKKHFNKACFNVFKAVVVVSCHHGKH